VSDEPAGTGAERCILVVEDDPTTTEMLRILLEDSGYRILTAETGEDALDLARETTPDLVTLDLGLPGGIDGRELLRRLRNEPATAEVPVIVLTGMHFVPASDERIEAVLTKPFDVAELEEAVKRVLGLRPGASSAQS
jgi:DNA-binding response OmpR family regulator